MPMMESSTLLIWQGYWDRGRFRLFKFNSEVVHKAGTINQALHALSRPESDETDKTRLNDDILKLVESLVQHAQDKMTNKSGYRPTNTEYINAARSPSVSGRTLYRRKSQVSEQKQLRYQRREPQLWNNSLNNRMQTVNADPPRRQLDTWPCYNSFYRGCILEPFQCLSHSN